MGYIPCLLLNEPYVKFMEWAVSGSLDSYSLRLFMRCLALSPAA